MIDKIVNFTNTEVANRQEKYQNLTATHAITHAVETNAVIGILWFSVVHHDNHLTLEEMFDLSVSGSVYRAAFSVKGFQFSLDYLWFDYKTTPRERRN